MIHRHARLPDVGQCAVQAAQKARHACEDGLLEVAQAAARLVLRRGRAAPDLVGAPRSLHVRTDGALHLQPLVAGQARAVQAVQLAARRLEVLEHRAAQRLRRVRREDQVHRLLAQRLVDGVGRDAGVEQRLQRAVGGLDLSAGHLAEALQPLALAVGNLLGQVVQVEHVGERAGGEQRLVELHARRAGVRTCATGARCRAAHLKARKHGLQLAESFFAAGEGEVVGELVDLRHRRSAIRAGSEHATNRMARTRQWRKQWRTAATLCFSSGPMVSSSTWRVRVSARRSRGALASACGTAGVTGLPAAPRRVGVRRCAPTGTHAIATARRGAAAHRQERLTQQVVQRHERALLYRRRAVVAGEERVRGGRAPPGHRPGGGGRHGRV